MPQQLTLKVSGQVQGVSFRLYACQAAQDLGLVGWVKNNPDGSVELLAQGEKASLEKLRDRCQQGPVIAQVESVEEGWKEIEKRQFSSFEIRYH